MITSLNFSVFYNLCSFPILVIRILFNLTLYTIKCQVCLISNPYINFISHILMLIEFVDIQIPLVNQDNGEINSLPHLSLTSKQCIIRDTKKTTKIKKNTQLYYIMYRAISKLSPVKAASNFCIMIRLVKKLTIYCPY